MKTALTFFQISWGGKVEQNIHLQYLQSLYLQRISFDQPSYEKNPTWLRLLDDKNREEYGATREAVEQLALGKQGEVLLSHSFNAQYIGIKTLWALTEESTRSWIHCSQWS